MIRTTEHADLERLEQLWLYAMSSAHPAVPRHYWRGRAAQAILRWRRADCSLVYVDAGEEMAKGFAVVSHGDWLQCLCVSPVVTGRGVGSALMEAVKRDRAQLQTSVLQENLGARYFLQQHGFVEVERRPCRGAGQNRLLMRYGGSAL
ncbi:GNAT family N-acetyltransferase [Microbulbifer taiwanensis]|uniref:GNAT family N-acetyltransferase n=1 Tax=Microbulbifer taiwanensis TaxID=986746 RepID=A0ABW1YMW6_9GAMM|nr:GNAT family N-acetyltransferase [Microbulbifer taiwanensis]